MPPQHSPVDAAGVQTLCAACSTCTVGAPALTEGWARLAGGTSSSERSFTKCLMRCAVHTMWHYSLIAVLPQARAGLQRTLLGTRYATYSSGLPSYICGCRQAMWSSYVVKLCGQAGQLGMANTLKARPTHYQVP